jgi:hypothetical protein
LARKQLKSEEEFSNGARQRLNALLTSLEKIEMTFESKTLTELSLFQY